jgi:hypothetical protein
MKRLLKTHNLKTVLDLANGESPDRTRASQWRIWHYGRYPWSSDVNDPCKEPPYALLDHFHRYNGPDTVQLMARNQSPSSAPSVSFLPQYLLLEDSILYLTYYP